MMVLALRGMAQRRLRTTLTALAVLLGVAMIAGTYVQTDQIRAAFRDIAQTGSSGVDAAITPKTAFDSQFATPPSLSERVVVRAAAVPGAARAEGQLWQLGALVVHGKTLQSDYAPSLVLSTVHAPFDPLRLVSGRMPAASGEVVIDRKVAKDHNIAPGALVGVTTRTGIQRVRVVGTILYGNASSLGGATLIYASLSDVQRWFRREGQVSTVLVAARPGVAPQTLVAQLRTAVPHGVEIKTGKQEAADQAKASDEAIGSFLTPALLAFSGAALLVGAFIIFNTFSITVAERTREFALLRAVGATRAQLLRGVTGEALILGGGASLLGLFGGLGIARLLGVLFDAADMGIPRGAMELAPRTIAVALAVGIGVTLVAAVVPALRATRVAPVAALRDQPPMVSRRRLLARRALTGLVALAGLALLLQGLLGSGTATEKMASMGGGALMFFVGTAMTARVVVRPLASAIGWPLQRLHPVVGELARDNAARNPARTAVTAAALMVGLALVVFVAVLAAGLKDSITGGIDRRLAGADLILTNGNLSPVSPGVAKVVAGAPGVSFVSPQYDEQVEVNGRKVSTLTDVLNGVEPARFARIYRADWRHGSEAALLRLTGDQAIIEEQFARQHGLAVGDRFRIRLANGRTAVLRATAEYRDPQVLQGLIINARTFRALSTTDPYGYFVQARPGVSDTTLQASVQRAVSGFPTLKVRTMPEYRQYIEGQVDRIVYLLYALLAMSVVISLFGIANSLFLAIHERTHELGLLRAIGGTAAQVRRMIRDESVITAVIGGLLGTAIGTLFAWLMTFALSDVGVGFHLPAGQLVGFLALAVAVGWIGAAMPARRAGRLNILEAVAE